MLLNTKNVVLRVTTVYQGNVSSSLVRVGELFRDAVRLNATGLILVHNHPSGDPTPSPDDLPPDGGGARRGTAPRHRRPRPPGRRPRCLCLASRSGRLVRSPRSAIRLIEPIPASSGIRVVRNAQRAPGSPVRPRSRSSWSVAGACGAASSLAIRRRRHRPATAPTTRPQPRPDSGRDPGRRDRRRRRPPARHDETIPLDGDGPIGIAIDGAGRPLGRIAPGQRAT